MITVRFASGFSVQYNDLNYLKRCLDGSALLYTSRADKEAGKGWSVYAPKECIIELIRPCRTYAAGATDYDLTAELTALRKKVDALSRKLKKVGAL